ncbi:Mth938-like domain-containing protein [Salisaeta longa]|uniref:Mth938-like domain-containing protein n=1 Tax=Salisaeta longa TaxID=503170 RepID=UPI0003B68A78|nr:Mth938-like domain-containing protein [Salisaeta longa]
MDHAPRITHCAWGTIELDGYETPFKDVKCYPGGARAWDWTETGTHHTPGIQPADVEELVAHGATVVVLSQGMHERLQVMQETRDWCAAREVTVHVLPTDAAVTKYNALRTERPTGGLFHSTC